MNTQITKQNIDEAIGIVNRLSQMKPAISTLPIILEQLVYLKQVYDRDRNFQAVPKGKLTIGVIAAKNDYDVIDPRLAELLYDIDYALDNPGLANQTA